LENGDINANISKFLNKYGWAIRYNDVVLVGSANQLAREGLAGYVRLLLEATKLLRLCGRKDVSVLPAPFVLLGGSQDQNLIRSILDLHAWIRISGLDPGGVLNDSLDVVEHNIRASTGEQIQPVTTVTYKLLGHMCVQ
jgi:hypothetical protein